MAVMSYPQILLIVVCFLFLHFIYTKTWILKKHKSCLPKNWPIIGMFPSVLQNLHCGHKRITEVLKESGGTFMFLGPCFANLDMLFTSDPANVQHILINNSTNFPKGPESNQIFDIFGDGIFNADEESWERHRKAVKSLLSHRGLIKYMSRISRDKVEMGLIPVLDHLSQLKKPVYLQDLFKRFTFDTASILVFGQDPTNLSIELPHNTCERAFDDVEEAILYRYALPEWFWKLQRWLQIGKEKKLAKAWEKLDVFVAQCISSKREESRGKTTQMMELNPGEAFDIFTAYMKIYDGEKNYAYGGTCTPYFEKFLRESLLNLMFAAGVTINATLTWFFWLLATNPLEEKKIREEIITNLHSKEEDNYGKSFLSSNFINVEELKKLVYLHGALCETLRLFPPVPLQHRVSVQPDVLPSGQSVGAKTRMVLSFYAMGRMETIWGKDCLEFKPGRWLTEQGEIKYEPPFKFTAFNAGPRSCLGKDMSFMQMKMVAAAIICNYEIHVLEEGHPASPSMSIVLNMKKDLKVKVTKRSIN